MVVARALGWGGGGGEGMGSYDLMALKFHFIVYKIKNYGAKSWWRLYNTMNIFHTTEPYI